MILFASYALLMMAERVAIVRTINSSANAKKANKSAPINDEWPVKSAKIKRR